MHFSTSGTRYNRATRFQDFCHAHISILSMWMYVHTQSKKYTIRVYLLFPKPLIRPNGIPFEVMTIAPTSLYKSWMYQLMLVLSCVIREREILCTILHAIPKERERENMNRFVSKIRGKSPKAFLMCACLPRNARIIPSGSSGLTGSLLFLPKWLNYFRVHPSGEKISPNRRKPCRPHIPFASLPLFSFSFASFALFFHTRH